MTRKRRLPYSHVIVAMAIRQAVREIQCRSISLTNKCGRQYLVRSVNGEPLPILRNSRSWGMQ